MRPNSLLLISVCCLLSAVSAISFAQTPASPAPAQVTGSTVSRLISFNGLIRDADGRPVTGPMPVTFSLFAEQDGGLPLWSETQIAEADGQGHYTVYLGATVPAGLPLDLFTTGAARWLAVQTPDQPDQPRVLLVEVPYALKAADADTLGGQPASAFALAGSQGGQTSGSWNAGTPTSIAIVPQLSAAATLSGSGSTDYVPLWTSSSNLGNSILFQSAGTMEVKGVLELPSLGTATASSAYDSQPFDLFASAYNSSTHGAVAQHFRWEAEPVSSNTSTASGKVDLLYAAGTASPGETGLSISSKGLITFASGQTLPAVAGNETVAGTLSASQLTSTVATGTAPLKVISTTEVANLNASFLGGLSASAFATRGANTFAGNQFINGTGAAGNYGLTVNQPSQTGILVASPVTGVGAGLDLQTTGSTGNDWEILATGSGSTQGLGKFNIRDIATGTDVFTISSTDAVTIGGALTLQGNVKDSSTGTTSSNVVGGWNGNTVTNSATGATIAGGGESPENGGPNTVSADFGTVGGGEGNTASNASTVAGGYANTASGFGSTIGGGGINTGSGSTSTVPGGYFNIASGDISFAAGFVAHATDSGSFVWCQQDGYPCTSSGTNSFVVSVNGPIYFYDGINGQGCYLSAGSGSWTCSSDRNLKDNIVSIDPRSVLDRVARMPISQWSMKADGAGHKHIGPMAQDFYAAFGLGETDKYIAQGDAQGVALASIQGLYQMMQEKLREKDDEIHALKLELQSLEERITRKQ